MSLKRCIRKWLGVDEELQQHHEALQACLECLEQLTADVAALHVALQLRRINGLATPLTAEERKRAH